MARFHLIAGRVFRRNRYGMPGGPLREAINPATPAAAGLAARLAGPGIGAAAICLLHASAKPDPAGFA